MEAPFSFSELNEKRVIVGNRQIVATSGVAVPAVIQNAGPDAIRRFVEFFTANIRNANTRMAYMRAIRRFCNWADDQKLSLGQVEPILVASYVELLSTTYNDLSVKQHLAAWIATTRFPHRVASTPDVTEISYSERMLPLGDRRRPAAVMLGSRRSRFRHHSIFRIADCGNDTDHDQEQDDLANIGF